MNRVSVVKYFGKYFVCVCTCFFQGISRGMAASSLLSVLASKRGNESSMKMAFDEWVTESYGAYPPRPCPGTARDVHEAAPGHAGCARRGAAVDGG